MTELSGQQPPRFSKHIADERSYKKLLGKMLPGSKRRASGTENTSRASQTTNWTPARVEALRVAVERAEETQAPHFVLEGQAFDTVQARRTLNRLSTDLGLTPTKTRKRAERTERPERPERPERVHAPDAVVYRGGRTPEPPARQPRTGYAPSAVEGYHPRAAREPGPSTHWQESSRPRHERTTSGCSTCGCTCGGHERPRRHQPPASE